MSPAPAVAAPATVARPISASPSVPTARATSAAPAAAAPAAPASRTEIKRGMSPADVRRALGEPQAEVVFGTKTRWTYPDLTIVFEANKVVDVRF